MSQDATQTPKFNRFGAFAVRMGYVTEDQLTECVEEQTNAVRETGKAKRLGEILIARGFMTAEQIREILRAQQKATGSHKIVGGFEIVAKIGVGGMGAVYKARQVSLDRMVALKILPPKFAEDEEFTKRFLREARAAASLNHPNVIQGIDVGFADGYHYFAMELVEGESLSEKIRREVRISQEDALQIAEEMAGALQHARSRKLVHRDVKPGNILIGADGVSKLADLGLARRAADDPSVSKAGKAIGTPYYISPEQAMGESDVDIRADIYSLGATLYFALTGRPAYDGPNPAVVMTKHLTDPVPSAREVNPGVSPAFDKAIQKMMAKDRDDRFQSPEDLLAEIQKIRAGKPSKAAGGQRHDTKAVRVRSTPSSRAVPSRRKSSPLPMVIGAVVVAAVVAVAALLGLGGGKTPPRDPVPEIAKEPVKEAAAAPAQADKRLQGMYEYAVDFAKKNPERYADCLGHFQEVTKEGRGTKFSLMASEEIEKIRRAQAAKVNEVYAQRKAASRALADKGRYGEAIEAAGGVPASLAGTDLGGRLAGLKSDFARAAGTRWGELRKRSAGLLKRKKYDEAAKVLGPARAFGMPSYEQLLDAELARIAAARKAHATASEARAAVLAKRQLDAVLDVFWEGLGKREYDAAGQKLKAFLRDRSKVAIHPDIKLCQADLAMVRDLWRAAEEGLGERVGKSVNLRVSGISRRGTVRWVRDGNVGLGIRSGRGEMQTQLPLARLDAGDVATFSGYEVKDRKKRLALAVFLLAEGEVARARTELGHAKRLGADVSRYNERLAVIDRGRAEVAAEKALAGLRRLVGAKRWEEADKALGKLRKDHDSTRAAGSAAKELASLKQQIDAGLLAIAKAQLFRDFTADKTYFVDSRKGDDGNDGSTWSQAWRSFENIYERRLPERGETNYILIRGRGPGSPYVPPGAPAQRRTNGYLNWRRDTTSAIVIVGVDDDGEAVFAPGPAFQPGQVQWFNVAPQQVKLTVVNLRFEKFGWCIQSSSSSGGKWIGCRFIMDSSTDERRTSLWGGTISLSVRAGRSRYEVGEPRVVRDCLFVDGGGATFQGSSAAKIEHCTFVGSYGRGIGVSWTPQGNQIDLGGVTVTDCLFAKMEHAFRYKDVTVPGTVRNCYAADVRDLGPKQAASGVKKLPDLGFADPGRKNYGLSPGSPVKGKATDGTDVGFRPAECAKAGVDYATKLRKGQKP